MCEKRLQNIIEAGVDFQRATRVNAPEERSSLYRFGVFELDTRAHELRKQGTRVRLQDQPYQILLALLERAGGVVTREELRHKVWPSSVYVDFDHGLNNAIARLREALGDAAATPTFIETLPRLGYRFIHPATRSAPSIPTAAQQIGAESPPRVQNAQFAHSEAPIAQISGAVVSRWPVRRTVGVVSGGVMLLALLAAFWPGPRSTRDVTAGAVLSNEPSLADLPFKDRLRSQGTRDPEAFRHYLIARGHISWLYGTPDWSVIKRSYQQAIERDPNFAAAHAGLAYYYFNREQDEQGIRLGRAAAERAVALDPQLSEAQGAIANFELLLYQNLGDFKAYARAQNHYRRALELDPSDAQAMFHYGRAMYWFEPDRALKLFDRTIELDPIRYSAVGFAAALMSRQGHRQAARERLMKLYDGNPAQRFHNAIHVATLEYFEGHLDRAIPLMRAGRGLGDSIHIWTLYMSLGDRQAAHDLLDRLPPGDPERDAAQLVMEARYDDAFASLERRLAEFPTTRALDVPAARLALIAAMPAQARAILESRLPDLVTGVEPINARNVLPALDLAAAWAGTGEEAKALSLLDRAAVFLDGPDAPRWPMFIFLRARTHALAGERDLALRALDRAYEAGFRTTWGVDMFYQNLGYIDPVEMDPAFAALRDNLRFKQWLERIATDNARQLARLQAHDAQERNARRDAQ